MIHEKRIQVVQNHKQAIDIQNQRAMAYQINPKSNFHYYTSFKIIEIAYYSNNVKLRS